MGQTGVFWNTVFIIAFAASGGLLMLLAPSAATSPPRDVSALWKMVTGDMTLSPWGRVFGAQAISVGSFYLLTLGFSPASRSFAFGSAIMRLVWASAAAAVIILSDGPWNVLWLVLLGDCGSALFLFLAVSSWERKDAKPHKPTVEWRGPYWSGLLHMSMAAAIGLVVLVDPYVLAVLVNIFSSAGPPRLAAVETPSSLQGDVVFGRLYACFSVVVGLAYARHSPSSVVASVGSRLVLISGTVAAAAITLSRAQGGDQEDALWLLTPSITAALPSLVSAPLCMLEHSIRAGKPDPIKVAEAQAAHVD